MAVDHPSARAAAAPRLPRWLLALPPLFGAVSVSLGKDHNVDLMDYHYYLAFALLERRFGHDLFPAGFHTFFNPLIELPFQWANGAMPAVALAFLLGSLQGAGAILLWLLAAAVIAPPALAGAAGGRSPLAAAAMRPGVLPAVVTLAGLFSGGSLFVAGTTYYDALVGFPVLLSLLLVLRAGPLTFAGPSRRGLRLLLLAGVSAGAAIGLKETAAPLARGVGLALLAMPGPATVRLANGAAFALGGALGVLALSGFWLLHLWELTGNPFFQHFNEVFRSPFGPIAYNRTRHAMPRGLFETLAYPLVFTRAPWRIDSTVRDPKLLLLFLTVPAALMLSALRGGKGRGNALAEPALGLFLLLFAAFSYAAFSYAVWQGLISIYRYIIPLEMLAPLLLVVAAGALVVRPPRAAIAAAVLVALSLPFQMSLDTRVSWRDLAWRPFVQASPPDADLDGAIVVAPGWYPGWQPYAFVIPFFPREVAFVHILGRPHQDALLFSGFLPWIEERIARHAGPIHLLYTPPGEEHAADSLAAHGLVADFAACRPITATLGRTFSLCPVARAGALPPT